MKRISLVGPGAAWASWRMAHGAWRMAHGAWRMAHGAAWQTQQNAASLKLDCQWSDGVNQQNESLVKMEWIPVFLVTFKVLVFGTCMFFAIKWHHDEAKKEQAKKDQANKP